MKVLLSWLNEFAPLGDAADAIGATMSDLGMAVEEQHVVGGGLDGVVVARILEISAIDGADRIRRVLVDAGDGQATQIVCGAPNISVGDTVPLATVGAVLPGDFAIAPRKMKGVASQGMLCSSRELAFGADHAGIMLLDSALAVGTPLREALGIEPDVLFDLEINPNRPDAMSVAGVARDIAARIGAPFVIPTPTVKSVNDDAGSPVTVDIVDADLCGRFGARVLRDVTVGSSPSWMSSRLTQLGMRPINALVDISNYVMLELGQPNHPYDRALVPGGGFRIRRARNGETITTLDDVERCCDDEMLLICAANDAPIGIAGVMGGASCEISDATTDVVVENAWFLPMSVSRTSRRLGLRTEASARFEKGCDPEVIDLAADRFVQLATEICGAQPAPGSVDVRGTTPDRTPIVVRTARVNAMLGTELSTRQMRDLLAPIGFTSTVGGSANNTAGGTADNPVDHDAHDVAGGSAGDTAIGDFAVTVPSWRYDSAVEIDVVEEIARMYGYANIAPAPLTSARIGRLTDRQVERRVLRRALVGLGLSESQPMPFLAPGELAACGLIGVGIKLANPLVAEESVLRPSLLPGLVQALGVNAQHRQYGVGLFEIGHVFLPPPDGQLLPDEHEFLAVIRGGQDAGGAVEAWQAIVDSLAVADAHLDNTQVPGLHPTRSGRVIVAGEPIGEIGEVDPDVATAHGIDERVAWLSIDLTRLLDLPHGERPYAPISRFPSSDIDLAFDTADDVPVHAIEATLRTTIGDLLADLHLFDVFRGAPIGDERRSLAFALRLQAPDRTLTDADVQQVRQSAIAAVESAHDAKLR